MTNFLGWFGIVSRLPPEYMFLRDMYRHQTLSSEKLERSSFVDPAPEEDIYTRLPSLIIYYLTRWGHLNLITRYKNEFFADNLEEEFLYHPEWLLQNIHKDSIAPFPELAEAADEESSDLSKR